MRERAWGLLTVWAGLSVYACSSTSGSGPAVDASSDGRSLDAAHDARRDSPGDATHPIDAALDTGRDSGPVPTTALVRLANFSPDSAGVDFCVAPRGTSLWSGPILGNALGHGSLGQLTVVDAGIPVDGGSAGVDAGFDSGSMPDAARLADGSIDGGGTDATHDASAEARTSDAGPLDAGADATPDAGTDVGSPAGARFLRFSPYIAMTPGEYDVRLIAGGALDCTAPLAADVNDFPALVAGNVVTFVSAGDTADQGTDPPLALGVLADDTSVSASSVAIRFINAVPSIIEVTFAAGTLAKGTAHPYLIAGQFGGAAAASDAGALDPNDYLVNPPIADQIWSLINANGGITTLVVVDDANVPAGSLATVVGVGGESGQDQGNIGILLCLDTPPIVAGETAKCELLQVPSQPVCDGCL